MQRPLAVFVVFLLCAAAAAVTVSCYTFRDAYETAHELPLGFQVDLVAKWKAHNGTIYSLSIHPNGGDRIATGGYDDIARVWSGINDYVADAVKKLDADDGADVTALDADKQKPKLDVTFDAHVGGVTVVEWSPNGKMLATASMDWVARVYAGEPIGRKPAYARLHTLSGHKEAVYGLAFSPDSKRLLTGSFDDKLIMWDTKSGDDLESIKGYKRGDVNRLCWSPDGKYIASMRDGGAAELIEGKPPYKVLQKFKVDKPTGPLWAGAFSPDSKFLATSSWDDAVRIFDVKDVHLVSKMVGHREQIMDLSWVAKRPNIVLSCSRDGTARLWDVQSQELLGMTLKDENPSELPDQGLLTCEFHPSGEWFATGGMGGIVKIYRVQEKPC